MIKDFLYLNEQALAQYVSQLEDGQRGERSSRTAATNSREGKLGGSGIPASGALGSENVNEETVAHSDTPAAQFERLLRAKDADADGLGWIDIVDADGELAQAPVGYFVSLDADIYIPGLSKALSSGGELKEAISSLQVMADFMRAAGQNLPANMPDSSSMAMLSSVVETIGGAETAIGEPDGDTDWKVYGRLESRSKRDDFEGFSTIVGKVVSRLRDGEHRPILSIPGQNLMSREARRAMERKGPQAGQEDNWVSGPAVLLNILAIYR